MSDKIIVIGNGFDLRHFLPTKYNHLITILREIEQLNINTPINFQSLFSKSFKDKDGWFYDGICEYYRVDDILFDIDGVKNIQKRLENNNWYQYLKTVEDSQIETWIDFETEINRVLEIILDYFESYNSNLFVGNPLWRNYDGERRNFSIITNKYKDYFKNKLQFNILRNFQLINEDLGQFSIINDKYVLNIDNDIQYYKEKYFFDSIYKELEEFIGIFNDYIIYIINPFYEHFFSNNKEMFIKKDTVFLFDNIDKILSFNYTDTYGKLYKTEDIIGDVLKNTMNKSPKQEFIHGVSKTRWSKIDDLKMVLGVSDVTDYLKKHKLFQFTKYFQKLHKNTDYLFIDSEINLLKRIENIPLNNIYYFWGHSLDVSDGEYIKDIFYVVEKTDSNICIFYHSISGKAEQLKNLLNIINKDIIESLMKEKKLRFMESTFENLYAELA
ncbi:AbiH family protein [Elizabethkingia anophelis]|uniref:AbiH family protein n=1 Tax=Elizabethkingia anophelis TaxID=1117645 RepID=UPI00293CBCBD|nr:hypothetical protein [Elizabethkingia anophelis]